MNEFTAPNIDSLVEHIGNRYEYPCVISTELKQQIDALFTICSDLKPVGTTQDEICKTIWLRVPRGSFDDYRFHQYEPYRSQKRWTTHRGYWVHRNVDKKDWVSAYPEESAWYKLDLFENTDRRALILNGYTVVNSLNRSYDWFYDSDYNAYELVGLLSTAAQQSMDLLRSGAYNAVVASELPYRYKFGTVKANHVIAYDVARDALASDTDPETMRDGFDADDISDVDTTYIGIMPCFISSCEVEYPIKNHNHGWLDYFMHVDDDDMVAFGDKIEWCPSKAELLEQASSAETTDLLQVKQETRKGSENFETDGRIQP